MDYNQNESNNAWGIFLLGTAIGVITGVLLAPQITEAAKNLPDQFGDKVRDAFNTAKDKVSEYGDKAKDKANEFGDKAQRFGEKVEDKAQRFGEKVEDKARTI